jgi:dUTP pyrophosphatase
MSYRMIETARRLMCDKFSVLCNLAELNAKQLREKEPEVDDTMKLNVKIKRLNEAAVIPKYAREGDSGFDLIATEDVIIEPGETKLIPTGLAFELPPGYEMQIRPRSGITLRTKLRVQLGTIDSGFRGEVKVLVDNIALPSLYINEKYMTIGLEFSNAPLKIDGKRDDSISDKQEYTYIIRKGDRICQAVIAPFETAHFVDTDKLEESMRGATGFGSSGV